MKRSKMSNLQRPCFKVLFVSQTARVECPYLDPSVRYRCYNPAEELAECGILADVIAQQRMRVGMVDNYDAFVFHRPYGGDPNLVSCMRAIRAQGKIAVADYDDLIFDPEFALQSSIFISGTRNEEQVTGIFNNNYLGLIQFDAFTVSTASLKEHVLKVRPGASVSVIHNGLSRRLLGTFDLRVTPERKVGSPVKVISYLSGTASHDADFAEISQVLCDFLLRHADFRIAVSGPLNISDGMPYSSVIRFPHREYRRFFSGIGSAYVNVAPLKSGNVFNECKSGLKFFESGIWGVPTIASPLPDFQRFSDSRGMLLAATANDWQSALERLADPDGYLEATHGLQDYCASKCMAAEQARKLLQFLSEGVE